MPSGNAVPALGLGTQRPFQRGDLVGVLVLTVVVATSGYIGALLVSAQFYDTDIFKFQEISLIHYLDGTADRPYVYRVLSPWLVHLVRYWHLPRPAFQTLDRAVLATCAARSSTLVAACTDLQAYATMAWIFATGLLISTYLLALGIFRHAGWAYVAYIVTALTMNAFLLQGFSHIYDFAAAFFATVMFGLAIWQRDFLFPFTLVAAILAKETLFLMVIVYALIGYGVRPIPRVALNLGVQLLIFIIIYVSERIAFAANRGAPIYQNVAGHVAYIGQKGSVSALLGLAIFAILLFYRYSEKPRGLRRGLMVAPLMFALFIYGGNPGEYRILLDVFPIVILPMVHSIRQLATANNGSASDANA
jgi:hypothetical protein